VQLYCVVGLHCPSLHVSAYMAIFRRVGYIYNGYCRLCLCLRAALLYVGFPLSFTTCFGLHGHLQVYRILHIFIFKSLRILLRCFFFFVRCVFFPHVVTLCMFSIYVLFLCCFPSLFLLFPCVCVCLLPLAEFQLFFSVLLQVDKHTHAKKQQRKRRKTAQEQNINGRHAVCDYVRKKRNEPKKKQRSRILQAYENKISYT
jgi:hypothetical protein